MHRKCTKIRRWVAPGPSPGPTTELFKGWINGMKVGFSGDHRKQVEPGGLKNLGQDRTGNYSQHDKSSSQTCGSKITITDEITTVLHC